MRIYILPAALTAITLIFSQCSQFGIELEMGKKELSLPLSVEQLGKTVAKDLHNTVINLHKMGVDYSDADASETFYDQFMADYLAANPIAVKTKGHVDFSEITDSKAFIRGFKNLTEIQLNYIDRIVEETSESRSYDEMCSILSYINSEIQTYVPEIQQERLLNIVSVLYYCGKELQYLEEQGLMPRTPASILNSIKTRSEPGSGSLCRTFLATNWAIAVGEPTPFGEIVAAVYTIYVGATLLYEVTVCKDSSSSDYEYCQEKFERCDSPIPDGCSECLQYCLTQGEWPPYSTHQCS